jgi:FixJ family two-component response regulator
MLAANMRTVVVIEDDPGTQRTLARMLRAGGYDAAVFESAEAFLASPPPAPLGLLLDVNLGGMSGLDLQRHLREEGSRVPVIVITAREDTRCQLEAESLGCFAYLRKPCEAGTILALLDRLIELPSAQ